MRRPLAAACTALFAAALLFAGSAAANADEGSVSGGSITIPASGTFGPGDPFPSSGTMSGVPGTISSVSLTLTGLSTTFPADLQIVVQAPSGKSIMVSGFCGGGDDIAAVDLTFVDGAPILSNAQIISGSYAPTACSSNLAAYPLPAPAPAAPYEATFASLNGEDPNGEWQLWIYDTFAGDSGSLASWTLAVTTYVAPAPAPAAAPVPALADTGVEATTITLGAVALLAAGGILLYTRRRYAD